MSYLGKDLVFCTYDIETSMNLGGYFGRPYDVRIAKIIQKGFVFGFAWKFLNKPRIYSCYIWDFPLYKKDPKNDIEVIKKWAELMQRTDVVIGWNSDKFDNRVMYGRLLIHKLPPLAMPQSVDVMKAVKKLAAYDSYKLNDVSEAWGHGNKLETDIELWWECLLGNKKKQREMVTYNKRDVEVTERDYIDVAPHMHNHPSISLLIGQPDACKHCGQNDGFVKNGFDYTRTGKFRRFQCLNCRGNNRSRTAEKIVKPYYV